LSLTAKISELKKSSVAWQSVGAGHIMNEYHMSVEGM
jgi:hypothetical protein